MNSSNIRWQRLTLLMAVVCLVLSGCAVTDIDKTADFSRYRTFGWGKADIQVQNPVYKSDLIDAGIRNTVKEEFAKRGIMYDAKNPDFLVSYQTYTERKEETSGGSFYGGYPYYPYRYYPFAWGWGWGWGMPMWGSPPRMRQYTAGTLIIDITDAHTGKQVWRGTVNGDVDDVKKLQKRITKGIQAILKKYPVTPEKAEAWKDEHPIS